jgi:5-methylcytosine-specific restriction endonuclease McrA
VATLTEMAFDLLIEHVKKERFAVGRKGRQRTAARPEEKASSRHIPDDIKRKVYERDGGKCTFTDETGRRCAEKGSIEYDHVDGFALTHAHSIEKIRLLCRAHNQHAADKLFGREFMDRARARSRPSSSRPSSQPLLV